MNYKTSYEIRNMFIKFFKNNNHKHIKSGSIIPSENDNSILFTNSGMNQFKDILIGIKKNYKYKNIVTIQKCIRLGGKHNDLENVGYTFKHHTFFEMLGNFSFGGYFKNDSIDFIFNILTDKNWFSINKEKLFITVHYIDEESYNIWIKMGINKRNILKIGNKNNIKNSDNFWKMGNNGPCGTSSEIFYINNNIINLNKNNIFNKSIEICNIVFMEFNILKNKIINLPYKSIDTGMGLERISMILQNKNSTYETDIFKDIINYICNILKFDNNRVEVKIISDHIRSIVFILNEGILPSNEGRGYILRKIIRRSNCYGIILNETYEPFLFKIVDFTINNMKFYKNEFFNNINYIKKNILNEEIKFFNILKSLIKILYKEIKLVKKNNSNNINSSFLFKLHDTYGFPIILIKYFLLKEKVNYNIINFNKLMKIQKYKSKIKKNI